MGGHTRSECPANKRKKKAPNKPLKSVANFLDRFLLVDRAMLSGGNALDDADQFFLVERLNDPSGRPGITCALFQLRRRFSRQRKDGDTLEVFACPDSLNEPEAIKTRHVDIRNDHLRIVNVARTSSPWIPSSAR